MREKPKEVVVFGEEGGRECATVCARREKMLYAERQMECALQQGWEEEEEEKERAGKEAEQKPSETESRSVKNVHGGGPTNYSAP